MKHLLKKGLPNLAATDVDKPKSKSTSPSKMAAPRGCELRIPLKRGKKKSSFKTQFRVLKLYYLGLRNLALAYLLKLIAKYQKGCNLNEPSLHTNELSN